MTISLQVPGAAYQSCVDEALRQAPFLVDRWCSRLVDALYGRSIAIQEPAERHQIQNAIAALKKNRALIEKEFPVELKKSMADDASAGSGRKSVSSAGSLSSVSFDELELMEDSQVQDTVESARLQQFIRLGCESGLASFTARLSTAQGFLMVKADSNPLRPEIIAQALFRLLLALPVASQARACWLLDGALLMGEELQSLYLLLNDLLAAQGIAPAAYGVIATPDSRAGRTFQRESTDAFLLPQNNPFNAGFASGRLEPDEESTRTGDKQLLTLDHLHHLLMGDYDNTSRDLSSISSYGSEEVVHQEFSHTLPFALDVLNELEDQGEGAIKGKTSRPAPTQSLAQLRAHLKTGAKSLGQSLAIEVVGMMIEQMAHDDRLLMPIRQVIANAEPAFLRLAVSDPRFFSDKSHPARRLLDGITSASLGYASENAPGFQEFMQSLQEVADLLKEEHASDAQHFAGLLREFERKQSRNTPANRQAQRRAVQALLQAEQRNLLAIKIAAEIRARPDYVELNRIITAFLAGPWSQVMAGERLQGKYVSPDSRPAVFSMVLDDLLWSLDLAKVASHRKRLLEMIPEMLKTLSEGLQSIGYPPEQSQPFFDALMVVHQAGLRRLPELPGVMPKSTHALHKMFEAREDEPDMAPLWLAPQEVQHSGFMENWDVPANPGPGPDSLQPQDAASPAGAALPGAVESIDLHLGDWVELLVDMQWLRAQLTWVSPHNTLYMFTSEGERKHSMTVRVLRHLLELKLVKVVSQQGVLDGALDGVTRTAMRNSVQGEASF